MSPNRGPCVTLEVAVEVARSLVQYTSVLGVELFGSIARLGKGDDFDLILLVNEDQMTKFLEFVRTKVWPFYAYSKCKGDNGVSSRARGDAAYNVLGFGFHAPFMNSQKIHVLSTLDVFLFTPDWRDNLDFLQDALPHSDPMFMRNIARDAILIA